MKIGRLAVYLLVLTCAIPAFFFGSSYLIHERGLNVPLSPYVMLVAWIGIALYVYWSTAFQEFNGRELLKLTAYCVVLFALIVLGISASYWAVTSVYGE